MAATAPVRVESFRTPVCVTRRPNLEISVPNAVALLKRMGEFGVHYGGDRLCRRQPIRHRPDRGFRERRYRRDAFGALGARAGRGVECRRLAGCAVHAAAHMQRDCGEVARLDAANAEASRRKRTCAWRARRSTTCSRMALKSSSTLSMRWMPGAAGARTARQILPKARQPRVSTCNNSSHNPSGRASAASSSATPTVAPRPRRSPQPSVSLARHIPRRKFGFHGHTDRGLGVANSRAAILAGASQVQGTLVGTGERCGNVNLSYVIGSMQLRGEAEFVIYALTGRRPGAVDLFCLRTGGAARRAHRRRRRGLWHMGRHARLKRAQESRRVSVGDPARVGATPYRRECAVRSCASCCSRRPWARR